MTTKDILLQVHDLGRRLIGINAHLPTNEAMTELAACADILHELECDLDRQLYRERRNDHNLPH